jgi:hypothetical protein
MGYVVIGFELAIGIFLACFAVWLVFVLLAAAVEGIARRREAAQAERMRYTNLPLGHSAHPRSLEGEQGFGKNIYRWCCLIALLAGMAGVAMVGDDLGRLFRRDASAAAPVKVTTPAEAEALAPGARYVTPDGNVYTR